MPNAARPHHRAGHVHPRKRPKRRKATAHPPIGRRYMTSSLLLNSRPPFSPNGRRACRRPRHGTTSALHDAPPAERMCREENTAPNGQPPPGRARRRNAAGSSYSPTAPPGHRHRPRLRAARAPSGRPQPLKSPLSPRSPPTPPHSVLSTHHSALIPPRP
jgi:hypothetical protein